MARRRRAGSLVMGVLLALSLPSAAIAASRPTPLSVVRNYLSALAAHHPGAVCRTFSPQLRAFEARWEPGLRGDAGCAQRVAAAHFSTYSPGQMVRRIRVIRVTGSTTDLAGNTAVRLVLFFRFPCTGAVAVIPGCRPRFERRPDIIYLQPENGRWLIVKPGMIYQDTSADASPPGFNPLTPPGDSSTVDRLAPLSPPPFLCPTGGVTATDQRNDPKREAPWLDVTRVSVVRLARQSLCVTITLAAPPRADSSYSIDLGQPQNSGETVDSYGLEIDGTGGLHPDLTDAARFYRRGASACQTAVGLSGDQLELIVSPGDTVFRNDRTILLDATAESLQPGEPLLLHPLDATDIAPSLEGMRLPPIRSSDLPRCFPIPTG